MRRYIDPQDEPARALRCGPNDGGIKRGDRAATGDNQARPTAGAGPEGSADVEDESGFPTGDPSSLGANAGPTTSPNVEIDTQTDSPGSDDVDAGLTVRPATDASLGITDVDGAPPEDWAANTGETRVPEGENPVAWEPEDPEFADARKPARRSEKAGSPDAQSEKRPSQRHG